MLEAPEAMDRMVIALLPPLSRSLQEQFSLFRVMHHGTHEKQLSNVFAWLLDAEGSHELGDVFQRVFVTQVNRQLTAERQLPLGDYRVSQEVNTADAEEQGGDIADILLTNPHASVVIENYETSDGHGHGYERYLAHGGRGERSSVVVLLCIRREPHRQTSGWEQAAVVTYAEVLEQLRRHVQGDKAWQRNHPAQNFFIDQLVQHFTEGAEVVSNEDRVAFVAAMCTTGEGRRYGHRPQEVAAQEFADTLARHAKKQFEGGRKTLLEVKRALKRHAEHILMAQLNERLSVAPINAVEARFSGQWEWCVSLRRDDPHPTVYLEFGPSALVEVERLPEAVSAPDYSTVFLTRQGGNSDGIDCIASTTVGLGEVLAGLKPGDVRLRDGVLQLLEVH